MSQQPKATRASLGLVVEDGATLMLLICLAAGALTFLLYQVLALTHPYPLDYGEAPLVDQAMRLFQGQNIYAEDIDAVEVRRRIGMVFQKPNPFPKSIYENVAWGARINGFQGDMDALVEQSLRQAALWDDVKDKLQQSGLSLSGGQQQRLCIARTIAVRPDIILMDEPASALDPIATLKIEDLMRELAQNYTIIVVTHNMQQAGRVSDYTAFFMMDEDRAGYLVEYGPTKRIFTSPADERTEGYITGRFG